MCKLYPYNTFIPQPRGGILHFNFKCPLRNPGYAFHSHVNFKIHLIEIPISFSHITPTQNCTKSPHNSINHFDNHFDIHPKYPLTNTANKLSDKLKITQNLPNPQKITPNPNFKPNIYTQFFHYYSLQNPLNQAIF